MAFDNLKKNSYKKGVTLTELLVAMAIASGVSLGLVSIYIAHYRIFTNQNALVEAETQNKLAMDQILKYMHESTRFLAIPNNCGNGNQTTTLSIALLPLDENGNPFESGGYDNILFYRHQTDSSKLVLVGYTKTTTTRVEAQNDPDACNPADPPDGKVIATGVTNFSISYNAADFLDANLATITLNTQSKTIYGKTFTSTQAFKAYLKND